MNILGTDISDYKNTLTEPNETAKNMTVDTWHPIM